jgi:hypothetical protein
MTTYDARPSAFTQLTTTTDWEYLNSILSGGINAIDAAVGSAMTPSLDTGGRNAVLADGNAAIKGMLWRCDAPVSTPIPAASAQNRIDRLVLQLNRGATSSATVIQPVVVTGTPSGSPVIPSLVQTPTGIWQIPVSHWTSTSAGALTGLIDDRRLANDTWHTLPLASGWSPGPNPLRYKFRDGDHVMFDGSATHAAFGPASSVVGASFPQNYWPTFSQDLPAAFIADAVSGINVASSGPVQARSNNGNSITTTCSPRGMYPLD